MEVRQVIGLALAGPVFAWSVVALDRGRGCVPFLSEMVPGGCIPIWNGKLVRISALEVLGVVDGTLMVKSQTRQG